LLGKPVSIIILSLLVAGILTVAFNVQPVKSDYAWTETIYIQADGSIQPPKAPISSFDNVTYTLTDNIAGNVTASSSAIIIQRDNITIDGAGHTLQDTQAYVSIGIELTGRSNVTIKALKITAFAYGIWLSSSSNNSVSGNNITNNGDGIMLFYSYNNSVSGNNITANDGDGIYLGSSSNTSLSGNNVTANRRGILLDSSYDNSITGNSIIANIIDGIYLGHYSSKNNSVSGNNIMANGDAITAEGSNDTLYHNNFINNNMQVFAIASNNVWDDGYPSGGNYWSNYAGLDLNGGPYQNQTSSDGIGDIPYVIDDYNRDNYPLMNPYPMKPYPWDTHDIGITNVATSKSVVGQEFSTSTNVLIFNFGNGTEAVNVTIYANQTIIGEIYNINVTSGNFALAAFTWNTTGSAKGNYTISAYAWPVPGETDTADNNFTGGWVFVTMVGDLTGGTGNPWDFVPDGKCDGKDIGVVAKCYGSKPGSLPPEIWNANCDVNNDGKCDGKDIATVAKHYGEHE
jgi:parallel beta-helix repeat protein